jgi:predicted RNA-binding protein associated with RNAse of E/G family
VWWVNGQEEVTILDEDELKAALMQNYVTNKDVKFAYSVANELRNKILENHPELEF